jgi:hypothetical protein
MEREIEISLACLYYLQWSEDIQRRAFGTVLPDAGETMLVFELWLLQHK